MGQVLVSTIVDKVRADLVDEDAVTWTDADLIEDMNEGIRALCSVKTDSYVITEFIPMTDGTRQLLPANGIALFDLALNEVSKRRITQVDAELLDETSAFWPADAETVDVIHFTADPRDKTEFVVYPPNTGYGSVRATYGAIPAALTISDIGDPWPLPDQYEPAVVQYMLAAAYRRNTQRQDLAKTQGYTQAFFTLIGLSAQTQAAVAPKVSRSQGA